MANQTLYKPGTRVWALLVDNIWWPGVVVHPSTAGLPPSTESTINDTIAYVHFESDDIYKVVCDEQKICLYSSVHKLKYIEDGYSLYLEQTQKGLYCGLNMKYFVNDVLHSEQEIGGNLKIFELFNSKTENVLPLVNENNTFVSRNKKKTELNNKRSLPNILLGKTKNICPTLPPVEESDLKETTSLVFNDPSTSQLSSSVETGYKCNVKDCKFQDSSFESHSWSHVDKKLEKQEQILKNNCESILNSMYDTHINPDSKGIAQEQNKPGKNETSEQNIIKYTSNNNKIVVAAEKNIDQNESTFQNNVAKMSKKRKTISRKSRKTRKTKKTRKTRKNMKIENDNNSLSKTKDNEQKIIVNDKEDNEGINNSQGENTVKKSNEEGPKLRREIVSKKSDATRSLVNNTIVTSSYQLRCNAGNRVNRVLKTNDQTHLGFSYTSIPKKYPIDNESKTSSSNTKKIHDGDSTKECTIVEVKNTISTSVSSDNNENKNITCNTFVPILKDIKQETIVHRENNCDGNNTRNKGRKRGKNNLTTQKRIKFNSNKEEDLPFVDNLTQYEEVSQYSVADISQTTNNISLKFIKLKDMDNNILSDTHLQGTTDNGQEYIVSDNEYYNTITSNTQNTNAFSTITLPDDPSNQGISLLERTLSTTDTTNDDDRYISKINTDDKEYNVENDNTIQKSISLVYGNASTSFTNNQTVLDPETIIISSDSDSDSVVGKSDERDKTIKGLPTTDILFENKTDIAVRNFNDEYSNVEIVNTSISSTSLSDETSFTPVFKRIGHVHHDSQFVISNSEHESSVLDQSFESVQFLGESSSQCVTFYNESDCSVKSGRRISYNISEVVGTDNERTSSVNQNYSTTGNEMEICSTIRPHDPEFVENTSILNERQIFDFNDANVQEVIFEELGFSDILAEFIPETVENVEHTTVHDLNQSYVNDVTNNVVSVIPTTVKPTIKSLQPNVKVESSPDNSDYLYLWAPLFKSAKFHTDEELMKMPVIKSLQEKIKNNIPNDAYVTIEGAKRLPSDSPLIPDIPNMWYQPYPDSIVMSLKKM